VQKIWDFFTFMVSPHGQGGVGMEPMRTRGDLFFYFVRTSFMDGVLLHRSSDNTEKMMRKVQKKQTM